MLEETPPFREQLALHEEDGDERRRPVRYNVEYAHILVSVGPGAYALTVMLCRANSRAVLGSQPPKMINVD